MYLRCGDCGKHAHTVSEHGNRCGIRPPHNVLLAYTRRAVECEARRPHGWSYDRQAVMVDVLNEFLGLTNSEEDEEYILTAVREAEDEYNEKHGGDL